MYGGPYYKGILLFGFLSAVWLLQHGDTLDMSKWLGWGV